MVGAGTCSELADDLDRGRVADLQPPLVTVVAVVEEDVAVLAVDGTSRVRAGVDSPVRVTEDLEPLAHILRRAGRRALVDHLAVRRPATPAGGGATGADPVVRLIITTISARRVDSLSVFT